jgi:hypothetical protein
VPLYFLSINTPFLLNTLGTSLAYYFAVRDLKKIKETVSVAVSGIALCTEIVIFYQKSYLSEVLTIPETRFKRDSHE